VLRWVQGFQSSVTDFSAREGAEELARLLRPGHRFRVIDSADFRVLA
jgi:hypothetical protein